MSDTITIEVPIRHHVLKGNLHVITSDWFEGLYVAGQTEEQVRSEVAAALVYLIKCTADAVADTHS